MYIVIKTGESQFLSAAKKAAHQLSILLKKILPQFRDEIIHKNEYELNHSIKEMIKFYVKQRLFTQGSVFTAFTDSEMQKYYDKVIQEEITISYTHNFDVVQKDIEESNCDMVFIETEDCLMVYFAPDFQGVQLQ